MTFKCLVNLKFFLSTETLTNWVKRSGILNQLPLTRVADVTRGGEEGENEGMYIYADMLLIGFISYKK